MHDEYCTHTYSYIHSRYDGDQLQFHHMKQKYHPSPFEATCCAMYLESKQSIDRLVMTVSKTTGTTDARLLDTEWKHGPSKRHDLCF